MREPQHPETSSITLTGVLYALSDPARLEIVKSLKGGKEKLCSEFGYRTKATMSHHFKVLREAGVTHTRIEGRNRYTSLRQDDLDRRFPGLLEAVLAARKPL
jgi:DNA-binding transcriptional ArsR family regulator